MRNITDKLNERLAEFGLELAEGDWIEFAHKGSMIYGEIAKIDGDDLIVIPGGWKGTTLKKEDIKDKYKVPKNRKVIKLNVTDKTREAFHKYLDSQKLL